MECRSFFPFVEGHSRAQIIVFLFIFTTFFLSLGVNHFALLLFDIVGQKKEKKKKKEKIRVNLSYQ